jgi:hypothetical protein
MAIYLGPPDPTQMQEFKSISWQQWFKDLYEIIRKGPQYANVRTSITANATLDFKVGVVFVDATGGNITLTLPKANVLAGYSVAFKIFRTDSTANVVTVAAASGDTINAAASITIAGSSLKTINSDGNTKYYGY